jgi:hypothetical protein
MVFARLGLDGDVLKSGLLSPSSIAEGHREKTLLLLWQILFKWRVQSWASPEALMAELSLLDKVDSFAHDSSASACSLRLESNPFRRIFISNPSNYLYYLNGVIEFVRFRA